MNSNKVWGGGEKWHFETASYLSNAGYKVLVISNIDSQLHKKVVAHPEIDSFACRINNYSFLNPIKVLRLRKLLKEHHVQNIVLGLSNDAKIGGIAAKLARVKKIIYRRGSAIPVKDSFLNRFLFNHILTNIVSNSEEIKKTIFYYNQKIIAKEKVKVIYNGIRLDSWKDSVHKITDKEGQKPIVLGNAGRLVEQKGHEYLINIAKELKRKNVPFELFIAGSGRLEGKLNVMVREGDLEKEVVFLNFVEDVKKFLERIDLYCSTSIHEGTSHVILEAMAAGKPLMAFDVSSMPEMISHGYNGYLEPFANIESYVARIVELHHNRSLLHEMGKHSRELVEEKFNFSVQVKKFIELIEGDH